MDANRPTILIVEDDANLSRVVAIRLKAAGFDVAAVLPVKFFVVHDVSVVGDGDRVGDADRG